jgi:hypothetical protein
MAFFRFVHLFTFVFWYGTLLYFTFIQAPVLFKALPRDIFGLVQSKLFPPFYILSYICGTALIVTYHFTHPLKPNDPQDCVKITALYLMLLLSLGQGMWIGPKAAQLRLDRMAAEEGKDTSKAEALNREFRKAHGISSLINLLVILSGLVYLIFFNFERGTPSLIQRILG